MGFWASYASAFRRFADFNGRTSRGVFWRFFAVNLLISVSLTAIAALIAAATTKPATYYEDEQLSPVFYVFLAALILYSVAVLIPVLAIQVRRLHDMGHSGWWVLLALIGLFGLIPLMIMWAQQGKGDNRWGPGGPDVDAAMASPSASTSFWATPKAAAAARATRAPSAAGTAGDEVSGGGAQTAPSGPMASVPTSRLDDVLQPNSAPTGGAAPLPPLHMKSTKLADIPSPAPSSASDQAHAALREMINKRTGGG